MKETKPCINCGRKITNKQSSSIYCKDCADIHEYIGNILGNAIYQSRRKHPNLKIKYKLKLWITKKNESP